MTPRRGDWAAARAELIIAGTGIAATTVAALAVFGAAAAALVLIVSGVAALVTLRALARPGYLPGPAQDETGSGGITRSFTGLFRRQSELSYGLASLSAYDAGLRRTLQRLLAARLSERHGISLLAEPEAARRLLCPGRRDDGLWFWVDPSRPPGQDDRPRSGIPPRTLAILIDRLERL